MRELTDQEKAERDRRRSGFDRFLNERMPVLADFAEALDLNNPPMFVADPGLYLPSIDAFMRDQVVQSDDRVWVLTRLGYFIGELLVQRLGGCWFLNEIPDSRYFLRYVVGQFSAVGNRNAMIDPFQVAEALLVGLPGSRLSDIIGEVEAELRAA
jgi:hypothetical protein